MIRLLRYLVASLLWSVAVLTAEEKQAAIVLPAEFELPSPPVADAENGVSLFLKEFGVLPDGARTKRYDDSLEALKAGKPLPDPQSLDEFRRTYDLGKQHLKPPLLFHGRAIGLRLWIHCNGLKRTSARQKGPKMLG